MKLKISVDPRSTERRLMFKVGSGFVNPFEGLDTVRVIYMGSPPNNDAIVEATASIRNALARSGFGFASLELAADLIYTYDLSSYVLEGASSALRRVKQGGPETIEGHVFYEADLDEFLDAAFPAKKKSAKKQSEPNPGSGCRLM